MHHFNCFRLSSIVKLACCILIRKIHIRWWFQFHQSSLLQAAAPLTKGLLAISFHGEMNMKLNFFLSTMPRKQLYLQKYNSGRKTHEIALVTTQSSVCSLGPPKVLWELPRGPEKHEKLIAV